MSTTSLRAPSEAALVEELAAITRQENALAARQQDLVLAFARAHVESQIASGSVEPEKLERSIAAQIGYACQVSATEGRRRMRMVRDLHHGHSHVRELFAAGALSEYRTSTIVAATAHLDPDERASVDQRLAEHQIETLGTRKLEGLARKLAAEVAPEKFAARCRAARTSRRVTVRPRTGRDGLLDRTAPAGRSRGLLSSPAPGGHRGRGVARAGHPQPRAARKASTQRE